MAPPAEQPAGPGSPVAYDITVDDGIDAFVDRLSALLDTGARAKIFQTCDWLATLIEHVAPTVAGTPRLVVARDRTTGALAVALPLLVMRQRGLRVAEIPDLGLSDYCAPLLGPAAPDDAEEAARLTRALLAALGDVDRLHIDKMPRQVEGALNPLVLHDAAVSSRFNGNRLRIESSVENFLAARGKKYRKEAERSRRRLEDFGAVEVRRAMSGADIVAAYATLEAWQRARHREAGHDYWLDRPEVSRFYLELLLCNLETGSAAIYTLNVAGAPVAVLLGVIRNDVFVLLRIADAGGEWRHTSPGRMIVLGVMEELVARDIRTFDMGIGDYPFKRWIGCEAFPLYEVDIAVTLAAVPFVLAAKLKRRLRQNKQLRWAVDWVKSR